MKLFEFAGQNFGHVYSIAAQNGIGFEGGACKRGRTRQISAMKRSDQ